MPLKSIITGKAFALVRLSADSAWMLKNKLVGRSVWLTDEDARGFYRDLGSNSETGIDGLLNRIWTDGGYSALSWSDAVT